MTIIEVEIKFYHSEDTVFHQYSLHPHSDPEQGILLDPDPYPACCWIRIQSRPGSKRRFIMTKFVKMYNRAIFWSKTAVNSVSVIPCNWLSDSSKITFLNFIPFLGANFGLPGSGSGFPIRIRWPNWIRVRTTVWNRTILEVKFGCCQKGKDIKIFKVFQTRMFSFRKFSFN